MERSSLMDVCDLFFDIDHSARRFSLIMVKYYWMIIDNSDL